MNWIQQNLVDRAEAFENFLSKRRAIICEMQMIHNKLRSNQPMRKTILLREQQQTLILQLRKLEIETEQRLNDIRERRRNASLICIINSETDRKNEI